jgi:hypothetical protein
MLLQAAIVPPLPALEALARLVKSVEVDPPAAPSPAPPRQGLFRRRPAVPPPPVPDADGDELDLVHPAQVRIPIAGFGNVTTGDAARLADTLRTAAADWARPTVWFAGGGALEFPGDRSVWAKLDGDIDALVAVSRGVIDSVASRGFFVDRRAFRASVAVGTITDTTTAPYLERVVAALDAFRGEPWSVDSVSVIKPSFDSTVGELQEVYDIAIGTG